MGILTSLGASATLIYLRRRHPFLPRQAGTVSSVLAYIHQSRMLYDFVGTEKYNSKKMERHLAGLNKTYGLGWFTGRDGQFHCGIDEEPLKASYKFGKDYRDTVINPGELGDMPAAIYT
jgi:hypothetical protein